MAARGKYTPPSVVSLLLLFLVSPATGHIVLTFPPARSLPLDFLDSARTTGPCGMPKDSTSTVGTTFRAGYNVTLAWHVAYPHQGGTRVEVMDQSGAVLQVVPEVGWMLAGDAAQQTYTMRLPNTPCDGCVVRLVRQAEEWGSSYLFWSCADITLVDRALTTPEMCSGRGTFDGLSCECEPRYIGDHCQFENECSMDSDCGTGTCVDTQSTYYPKLQCYCPGGKFGRICEHDSPVKSKSEVDLSNYKMRMMSDEYTLYHRTITTTRGAPSLLEQEVEIVMKVKSSTWVGLGWRSADASATCTSFPVTSSMKMKDDESAEPEAETAEPESEPPSSEPEDTAGRRRRQATNPCDGRCNGRQDGCLFDVTWVHNAVTQSLEVTVVAELQPSDYFAVGFSNVSATMDSTDIVTGWMNNGSPVVHDRWAAYSGTPTVDLFQDATVMSGSSNGGITTITYTKPLSTGDTKDLDLNGQCVYILTARGTKNDATDAIAYHSARTYTQMPDYCFLDCPAAAPAPEPEGNAEPTTAEPTTAEPATAEPTTAEPTTAEPAIAEPTTAEPAIAEPTTAEPTTAEPTTAESVPVVEPTTAEPTTTEPAEVETVPKEEPTTLEPGIAEGTGTPEGEPAAEPESDKEFHSMDCTDIVVGSARGDLSRVGDYYTRDRSTPQFDAVYGGTDSLTAALGWEEGGYTYILFRKPVMSNDEADWPIQDALMHVIWARGQETGDVTHRTVSAVEAGTISDSNYYKQDELKYHGSGKHRGVTYINLRAPIHRPAPAQNKAVYVTVASAIRMPDLEYDDDQFGSIDKPAARELARVIETQLNKDLKDKVLHFVKTKVVGFRAGSIIADVDVIVKAEKTQGSEVKDEVTVAMTEVVKNGTLGDYNLDTSFIEIKSSPRIDITDPTQVAMGDGGLNTVEIVIVAVAVTFCTVAIVVVAYKLCEANRNTSVAKNRLSNSSGISGYSIGASGGGSTYNDMHSSSKVHSKTNPMAETHFQQAYDNPGYQTPNTGYSNR